MGCCTARIKEKPKSSYHNDQDNLDFMSLVSKTGSSNNLLMMPNNQKKKDDALRNVSLTYLL